VTVSAVTAILGSIFVVLLAASAVASLFIQTTQPRPANSTTSVMAGAAMLVAFAVVGIWTSIGVFRLRPWARVSMLVFAGFLAGGALFGLIVTSAVPAPPDTSPATQEAFHRFVAIMCGIPLAIGVWWLVQFNVPSTKAAFASATLARSVRPMSVTIIAWLTIIGGLTCLMGLFTRAPALLLGAAFTGWIAGIIYAMYAAFGVYIGRGLLELRDRERLLAIGWYALSLINVGAATFVPSARDRIFAAQALLRQTNPAATPFDPGMIMNVAFGFSAVFAAVTIWLLVRERRVFIRR
jgi:hypothetical protein